MKLTNNIILLSSLILENLKPLEKDEFIDILPKVDDYPSNGFIFIIYSTKNVNNILTYYYGNKYFYNYYINKNKQLVIVMKYDDCEFLNLTKEYGLHNNYTYIDFYNIMKLWHNYIDNTIFKELIYKYIMRF